MDIKISIELKDKYYGFSDLLDGRELNNQTKEEIIELIKEDIGYAFDQQIEVEAINYTRCCETVANKENKDFFKWVESEKIERISDFYFLIGDKKHTYNYVKKKYRMYLQKKQMFY